MAACIAIVCTLASGVVVFYVPLPLSFAKLHENEESIHEKNPTAKKKTEFTLIKMLKLQTPKSRAAVSLLIIKLNMALAFHIFNTI